MDSRNCQTFTASPAQPGELPDWFRMADPGKIGIIEEDIDAVFASYLVRLSITDRRIDPYYLFYFLNGDSYQNFITGASTGTTRKSASAEVMTNISIPIPPKNLLDQFSSTTALLRRNINSLLKKSANLRAQRDLLLPKLVSGELDVSALRLPDLKEEQAA